MKSFRYELIVYINNVKLKRFLGNDINTLKERYEMWVIKQSQDKNDMSVYIGEV